jgi:hypothetical protein
MTEVVSRLLLAQFSPCGICGGQRGTVAGFSPCSLAFFVNIIPP